MTLYGNNLVADKTFGEGFEAAQAGNLLTIHFSIENIQTVNLLISEIAYLNTTQKYRISWADISGTVKYVEGGENDYPTIVVGA